MSSPSVPSDSEMNPKKTSSDRHRKVNGRDRRVLLSAACTRLLSEVSVRLGHSTMGETIEWLIAQAKPSVDAVIGSCSVGGGGGGGGKLSYPIPVPIPPPPSQPVPIPPPPSQPVPIPPPPSQPVFPMSNGTGFGYDFPIVESTAQIPTSVGEPSFPVSEDHGLHQNDVNFSSEMIQKFLSEFSL